MLERKSQCEWRVRRPRDRIADFHRCGRSPTARHHLKPGEIIICGGTFRRKASPRNNTYLKCARSRLRSPRFCRGWLELDGDTSRRAVSSGCATGRGAIHSEAPSASSLQATRFARAADVLLRDAHGYATTASRRNWRAAASCAALTQAARGTHSRISRKSSEQSHVAPYIRHFHIAVDGSRGHRRRQKYAAEFNEPGLASGSVVPRQSLGAHPTHRFQRALRVKGVLDVLTHENRPPWRSNG